MAPCAYVLGRVLGPDIVGALGGGAAKEWEMAGSVRWGALVAKKHLEA